MRRVQLRVLIHLLIHLLALIVSVACIPPVSPPHPSRLGEQRAQQREELGGLDRWPDLAAHDIVDGHAFAVHRRVVTITREQRHAVDRDASKHPVSTRVRAEATIVAAHRGSNVGLAHV